MNDNIHLHGEKAHLKGKTGEQVAYELAQISFLKQWCFLNPKLLNGKELCDLLIIFDNTVFIWEVKTVTLQTEICEDSGVEYRTTYKPKVKEKAIRQVTGAYNSLFKENCTLNLENYGLFDPANFDNIFLCTVFMGESEIVSSLIEPVIKNNEVKYTIHIINEESLKDITTTLDTVTDFVEYFKAKESFLGNTKLIIDGGERELLAFYIKNKRELDINHEDIVILDNGIWNNLQNDIRYQDKQKADQISIIWDEIIRIFTNDFNLEEQNNKLLLMELVKPNRFYRRVLSHCILDMASVINDNQLSFFSRCIHIKQLSDIVFCFIDVHITTNDEVFNIQEILKIRCMTALYEFPEQKKSIGFARVYLDNKVIHIFAYFVDITLTEHEYTKAKNILQTFTNTRKWHKAHISEYQN